ncbi:ABC-type lipoprotein export system ATPase subunit [Enterococcus sp. PF1-24]|nr:ABC-type lipoprotein export system ATPase subunit [Enterococcus sp. PFB1-1]MDH6400596.1 ABC-type lipoprotein export system ATPase subunit [Enterococcus sp. PF1-24]
MIYSISDRLDITNILDKFPYEVSGGQRQRCTCARALVAGAQLILADEPTGALDSISAHTLMETFNEMNRTLKATILVVTHDPFAACFCNRILFMKDGNIVSELQRNDKTKDEFLLDILFLKELIKDSASERLIYQCFRCFSFCLKLGKMEA